MLSRRTIIGASVRAPQASSSTVCCTVPEPMRRPRFPQTRPRPVFRSRSDARAATIGSDVQPSSWPIAIPGMARWLNIAVWPRSLCTTANSNRGTEDGGNSCPMPAASLFMRPAGSLTPSRCPVWRSMREATCFAPIRNFRPPISGRPSRYMARARNADGWSRRSGSGRLLHRQAGYTGPNNHQSGARMVGDGRYRRNPGGDRLCDPLRQMRRLRLRRRGAG